MKKNNWKLKYKIVEKILIDQLKWSFSSKYLKEGISIARQLIRSQIKDQLKSLTRKRNRSKLA